MDRTLVTPTRLEVRGGTFTLVDASDDVPPLHVGPEPRIIGRRPGCHLVLPDAKVSATHCEVVATDRGVRLRDLGSSNGAYVGELRIVEALLTKPCTLRCGDTMLEFQPGRSAERVAVSKSERFGPLVGSTPVMRALFEQLRTLAPTTVSVLVEGETGTGKELVAQALHEKSDRADRPFVVVDCSAIPSGLAESTLFGHEKGAFTGATARRISPFVQAHGGTLFLDEIGELPLEIQPKLLRALAEQRVQSVGGTGYVPVDVRVVAATRRDLLGEINKRAFRDDLYFRLAQARITVPPLRERTDDLGPLVQRLLEVSGHAAAYKRVTPESLDRLDRHDWPGNVRELRNLVLLALAFDKGGRIDLAAHISDRAPAKAKPAAGRGTGSTAGPDLSYRKSKEEHDRLYFTALYKATGGNVSAIGRRAQIDRETVRVYLNAHRIGAGAGRGTRTA
jgi:DNA-binding NtrC family response regulator